MTTEQIKNERLDQKIETTRGIIKVIHDFGVEKGISPNVVLELVKRIEQI